MLQPEGPGACGLRGCPCCQEQDPEPRGVLPSGQAPGSRFCTSVVFRRVVCGGGVLHHFLLPGSLVPGTHAQPKSRTAVAWEGGHGDTFMERSTSQRGRLFGALWIPSCHDSKSDAKEEFNVLSAFKNTTSACTKHVAGDNPTTSMFPRGWLVGTVQVLHCSGAPSCTICRRNTAGYNCTC